MTKRRREVPLFERRAKIRSFPRPHAVDEVLEMLLAGIRRLVAGQCRTRFVLASKIDSGFVIADLHPPFRTEDENALGFGGTAEPVSQVAMKLCSVRIPVRRLLCVRCLLIGRGAGLVKAAAAIRGARMFALAEQPSGGVE